MCTSSRASIMCATRFGWIAWRTGRSLRCRPKKSAARAPDALPLEIARSKNITVANYHGYRVISSYRALLHTRCASRSRAGFDSATCTSDSNSKVSFDNSVFDSTHHAEVRAREFAALDVPGDGMRRSPPMHRLCWLRMHGSSSLRRDFSLHQAAQWMRRERSILSIRTGSGFTNGTRRIVKPW